MRSVRALATHHKASRRRFLAENPFLRPRTEGFFYREKMAAIHAVAPDEPFNEILEVGGGRSSLTALLYPRAQVTNVDVNPEYAANPANRGELRRFVLADATHLPFARHRFDAVTMFDVLEHIPEHAAAVDEALRVLRPGGCLMVSRRTTDGGSPTTASSRGCARRTPT